MFVNDTIIQGKTLGKFLEKLNTEKVSATNGEN